ncbi:probable WRKY transcription factor 2 isoform X1 [Solanum stenotomum]|uniref:probable WRKY transcription factor 2 isoform X1 n=1 Tax=Solanum stenotomum TaxID=172797 RepID=UPI0020D06BD9|nr:probable WRKY transcription factor 2 isoform X1 [Solanum stenotomum]XP_049412643.1 probable WRKY transcription factor 2 isoform X1 [Solanum stenotomum]XP_049412644.1 probable WRKY transcription factor 2 isoform X1 [Solanum stenotomum]XP_049412645.1 probable WRKY transcription factor 2 isoform X1 [Solanum stenotomum]
MGGFDDHVAIMGDWMPPSPSPRTFFSSLLGDDVGSRSSFEGTNETSGNLTSGPQEHVGNSDGNAGAQAAISEPQPVKLSALSDQKMSSRGGLLERIAARAGFNAPKLNTESLRPADLMQNQGVRSPYLTIPPGLSPTTLLESPVFLSNSLVQPSPTTGKFLFSSGIENRNSALMMEDTDKRKDNALESINSSSFSFKPVPETAPSLFPGTTSRSWLQVNPSNFSQQGFPNIEVSVHSQNSLVSHRVEATQNPTQNGTLQQSPDFPRFSAEKDVMGNNVTLESRTFQTVGSAVDHSPPLDEPQDEDIDQRGGGDPNVAGAPAEDGYNWRKYGQKQVKGSEYPRSYYKCTHPNCPVKKKVERSPEGHITEIIYKGAHNHPKPPPNRRSALGSTNSLGDLQLDGAEQGASGVNGDLGQANFQKAPGAGGGFDWRNNNLDATSSANLGSEYCNRSAPVSAQNNTRLESGDAVDVSSTFSNDEDEDDRGTHGSVSQGYDGEGDESESKRRKLETYSADMTGATRAIREPRVVVQTTSEVDILDDGYRWRKYGQKVVKGNPNPRSYYKCTSAGCNVRKHVERASHDLKSVITTYEGKHNHDVPAARNSSHVNSGASNTHPTSVTAPAQNHLHRPEAAQLQNAMARFDRQPSLGSFGLSGRPQLGPNPGFSYGMNQQGGLSSLAMAGFHPNQNKPGEVHMHPYLGQPRPMHDMGFMFPKEEPKVEPMSDPGLNLANGSAVYQQFMNRLPLGPHM